MNAALAHFDKLTCQGLKVIPLRAGTKVPMAKRWTEVWDRNAARERLRLVPDANIGLLLDDVVDVEGDDEEANREINDLVGDYRHPCYTSNRSFHHLFLSPDRSLRHSQVGGIEFRGHGHQSVLPPSTCQGVDYRWVSEIVCPIPPMPPGLVRLYETAGRVARKPSRPAKPKSVTEVVCPFCRKRRLMHKKRLSLEIEAFESLGVHWSCNKCRGVNVRPVVRRIKAIGRVSGS